MKATGNVAARLRSVNPSEPPGWMLTLELPEPARLILVILWRWRVTKRLVNPSLATLAKMLGRTERTVQRHLGFLQARSLVVRAYNGGRGRQCLYYLAAPGGRVHDAPLWPPEAHFGGLRKGRRALNKGDPAITLTDVHSTNVQREERETKNATPVAPKPVEIDSPPTPPSGGDRPVTSAAIPVSIWRAAWALWRQANLDYLGRQPLPDIRDAKAMQGLIREAAFANRQDTPETIRYLAWGFRRFCRDKAPTGALPDEQHPLWRLRRIRSEYGWPKTGWTPPSPIPTATSIESLPVPSPTAPSFPTAGSWERELARARTTLAACEQMPPALRSPRTEKHLEALRGFVAQLEQRAAAKAKRTD